MDKIIVKKSDWKNYDISKNNDVITVSIILTDKQKEWIKYGHKPKDFDDKWFVYTQDNKTYFHRSWTGFCEFIIEYEDDGNIKRLTVNRDGYYSNKIPPYDDLNFVVKSIKELIVSYSSRF